MSPPHELGAAPVSTQPRRQRSLGWKLVWTTLGFCALFILASVATLTWSAWNAGVARMDAELLQIEKIYSDTLSRAIWELDREALQAYVQNAKDVPSLGKISVQVRLANRSTEEFEGAQPGWTGPGRAPTHHHPLVYAPYPGAEETVGELALYGNERVLWQRLRSELGTIVLAQLLQSLMLAGLIMLMFHRMVTVHVRHIAAHLAAVRPSNLDVRLSLERSHASEDELTQLVAGVNQLQGSLSSHLEQQQRYEQELAGHRDRLSQLVDERTAALQSANEQLRKLARTDPLTGLPNRRHFDEAKDNEMRRAKRHNERLALLICDIDCFKDYNDHYGHAMGDRCLIAVAQALQANLGRAGDLVARIGGEEFSILLPGTNTAEAQNMAERLRDAVAGCGIEHLHSPAASVVTISVGLAVYSPGSDEDFDALFAQADQALYRAKASGRNRVAGAGNEGVAA